MHIYTEYLYVLICWYVAQQKHNGALHASLAKSCRFVRSSSRPPTVACCRWNASAPCTLKPSCETKTTKFFAVVVLCLFEMTTGFAWARWRLLQVICISCLVETCGTRQLVGTGHRKVWMVLFFFCCLHLSAKDCLVMLLRLVFHLFDIRLLSCMRDCPGGWTFCFDVKERSDSGQTAQPCWPTFGWCAPALGRRSWRLPRQRPCLPCLTLQLQMSWIARNPKSGTPCTGTYFDSFISRSSRCWTQIFGDSLWGTQRSFLALATFGVETKSTGKWIWRQVFGTSISQVSAVCRCHLMLCRS